MAVLLENMGRSREAIASAQEASRLDPEDPDPHWVLAGIYFNTQPNLDGEFHRAVRELETIRGLDPGNGDVYRHLGRAYFEMEEPEKAIEAYEKFQSIVPDADTGYREIANYYYRNKDIGKTIAYVEKALAANPDSADTLNLLGNLYTEQRRVRDAVPVYRKLLDITGDDGVKHHLAALLFESGQYAESRTLLGEILEADPGNADARIRLGRTLAELEEFEGAIEALQSVDDADPKTRARAQFHLGLAYKGSRRYAEAVETFTRLLESTPADTEENQNDRLFYQYHLTTVYLAAGEPERAVGVAEREFEANPGSARSGIFYADTLADAGRTADALAVLGRLLDEHPSETDLYLHLSQMHLKEKRYAEALSALERARNAGPGDAETLERLKIQRVAVYERQKDYDRAESLLRELLEANPNHAGALNYFGYMLADRGIRLDEALGYVSRALEIDPDNGAYLDSLGWAYFKLNDLENAETYLVAAGKKEKDDPVILDHLGDLYYKTGDFGKARDLWTESIRISTDPEEIGKIRRKLDRVREKIPPR